MGSPRLPEPVQLFAALMHSPDAPVQRVVEQLQSAFGGIAHQYGPVPFGFTSYYEKEMGAGLQKRYLVFAAPFARERLAEVKLRTNALERELAGSAGRTVNIDPGYLSRDKLVLASTKDFYHRLHLERGIYAEVTLHFRAGRYRHFSWTYEDYKAPELQAMLLQARAGLAHARRSGPPT